MANSPIDVVLVLDSSGSMANDNRMVELKASVKLFLDQFKSQDTTQVALVPFDTQVKADSEAFALLDNLSAENPFATDSCGTISDPLDRYACYAAQNAPPPIVDCSKLTDFIDAALCGENNDGFKVGTTGIANFHFIQDRRYDAFLDGNMFRITRKKGKADCRYGCTWEETYSTETIFEVASSAGAPATSKSNDAETANNDLIAQYPGPWPRCFIDRSQPYDTNATPMTIAMKNSIYPEAHCATDSLEPITPLTSDLGKIEAAANKLTPSGNTNVTIGVQWGIEALTAAAPLKGVRPDGEARKVMIVLTDGLNTQNRWWGSRDRDKIDARTLEACNNAKAMGIEMLTVRLIQGNESLLKACAENEEKYHYVTSSNQLTSAFAKLALQVKGVRLAW
ncbi:VWA domain-containing protein [Fulvimarina sp. MAC8]